MDDEDLGTEVTDRIGVLLRDRYGAQARRKADGFVVHFPTVHRWAVSVQDEGGASGRVRVFCVVADGLERVDPAVGDMLLREVARLPYARFLRTGNMAIVDAAVLTAHLDGQLLEQLVDEVALTALRMGLTLEQAGLLPVGTEDGEARS